MRVYFFLFSVKKDILPIVQSLCQDCYHEVRTAMCYELANIAKGNPIQTTCIFEFSDFFFYIFLGLGSDNLVKSSLLPSLVELSSDENVSVRAASVDAAVLMIPYLNQGNGISRALALAKLLSNKMSID